MDLLSTYDSSDEEEEISIKIAPVNSTETDHTSQPANGRKPSDSLTIGAFNVTFSDEKASTKTSYPGEFEDEDYDAPSTSVSSLLARYRSRVEQEANVSKTSLADKISSLTSTIPHTSTSISSSSVSSNENELPSDNQATTPPPQDSTEQPNNVVEPPANIDQQASESSTDTATQQLFADLAIPIDRRLQRELQRAAVVEVSQRQLTTLSREELIDAEIDRQFGPPRTRSNVAAVMWDAERGEEVLVTEASKTQKRKHQITELAAKAEEAQRKLAIKKAQMARRRY